ncbi:MAG TPA: alcohol dehydrogenase catalytic domain-containing protein [Streptosporangiaceae bacterium]|nr:alcohol dehydrogenase catalytic domain-containing protein [Streptosporangiaceae bacterium]
MQAVVLTRQGAGADGLAVTTAPDPVPGPGEVLIEVHAVSASRLELEQTMTGIGLGAVVRLPRVLGMDPAGVIVGTGDGVDPARAGQRVVTKPNLVCGQCDYCRAGAEGDCTDQGVLGVHRDGGAAQLVTVPAALAFPISATLDFVTAAAAVHSVSVALHMLRAAGSADSVLVLGASGAVGSAAVQLARRAGSQVLAALASPDGASPDGVSTIGYDNLTATVRSLAPDGVGTVIDTTGDGAILSAAIETLGWKGVAVTCASRNGPAQVDIGALYRWRRSLTGVAGTDFADVRDALAMVADGTAAPRIAATFPLAEARAAYTVLADRTRPGKIVMVP